MVEPFLVAAVVFCLGMALVSLLPKTGWEADEMGDRIVLRLLLGPALLAALTLAVDGVANHFFLIR